MPNEVLNDEIPDACAAVLVNHSNPPTTVSTACGSLPRGRTFVSSSSPQYNTHGSRHRTSRSTSKATSAVTDVPAQLTPMSDRRWGFTTMAFAHGGSELEHFELPRPDGTAEIEFLPSAELLLNERGIRAETDPAAGPANSWRARRSRARHRQSSDQRIWKCTSCGDQIASP